MRDFSFDKIYSPFSEIKLSQVFVSTHHSNNLEKVVLLPFKKEDVLKGLDLFL